VPYLANKITSANRVAAPDQKIRLVGMMINNACTDPRECY
jgi:hypothetical protein